MTEGNLQNDAFSFDETDINGKPFRIWGQMNWDAFFKNWEKGKRPEPFIDGVHSERNKVRWVKFSISPIAEMNLNAQWEKDGAMHHPTVSVPIRSAQSLGKITGSTEPLHDSFCVVEDVPSGEKYQKKNADGSPMFDEEQNPVMVYKKTYKFIKFFDSEDECIADFIAERGDSAPATEQSPAPGPAQTTILTRENALNVAMAVIKSAKISNKGDAVKEAVAEKFAEMPMINEHFSVDDAEIIALIEAE
jgi:hypothetical protein